MLYRVAGFALTFGLLPWLAIAGPDSPQPLHLESKILSGTIPPGSAIEIPDRIAIDPRGNVVLADTRLQALTKLDPRGKPLWSIAGGQGALEGLRSFGDLAVDPQGRILILDTVDRRIRWLTPQGKLDREVPLQSLGRRLVVNRQSEIVVNTWGSHLFEVYSARDGSLLRKFGERIDHGDQSLDFELNAGSLASGPEDEVYIAFPYPPTIRAYSRQGELLWQKPIELHRSVPEPDSSVSRDGEGLRAYFEYVVSSLGLGVDRQGRIACLVSGELKSQSVKRGAQRLALFSPDGQSLPPISLSQSAHRFEIRGNQLYLLTQFPDVVLNRFSLTIDG